MSENLMTFEEQIKKLKEENSRLLEINKEQKNEIISLNLTLSRIQKMISQPVKSTSINKNPIVLYDSICEK
jgi:predicted RNase H-like nuclease (RuvC/YqgF family)